MKIDSLKQLDKLMQLCRKRGVSSLTIDGVTFHMSDMPVSRKVTKPTDYAQDFPEASIPVPQFTGEITDPEQPKTDALTDDQRLFWSSDATEQVN